MDRDDGELAAFNARQTSNVMETGLGLKVLVGTTVAQTPIQHY